MALSAREATCFACDLRQALDSKVEVVTREKRVNTMFLEKLAETDPVHWKGREDDGVDGDQFYPVRFDTRRALREVQNNQPCSWRRR